jgi:hypothetical protein
VGGGVWDKNSVMNCTLQFIQNGFRPVEENAQWFLIEMIVGQMGTLKT